jgi:site-specific recombinase XerC
LYHVATQQEATMNAALAPSVQTFSLEGHAPSQRALAAAWGRDLAARVDAGQLSARTADAYLANAGAWLDWLDGWAFDMPTPAHVLAYVASLRKRLKPGSVNVHLSAVRAFYTWTETRNAYPAIARSVAGMKDPKDEPLECLDRGQVVGLLDLVDGDSLAAMRDRALVHVLFCTALRLVSLTGADLGDVVDGELTYQGKGDRDKGRRAYLSPSALDALTAYLSARRAVEGPLAPDAPLFAAVGNRAGGARLSARSVRAVVVALMERAGHVRRDKEGHLVRPRVLSAHSLRRSAVTTAFEARGQNAAQALAGHADPRTTMRAYARVQKGRILRDLAAVLDLGGAA